MTPGSVKLPIQVFHPDSGLTHAVQRLGLDVEEQDGGWRASGWAECFGGRLSCRSKVDSPDGGKKGKLCSVFFSIYGCLEELFDGQTDRVVSPAGSVVDEVVLHSDTALPDSRGSFCTRNGWSLARLGAPGLGWHKT